jgi:hypothetical protein
MRNWKARNPMLRHMRIKFLMSMAANRWQRKNPSEQHRSVGGHPSLRRTAAGSGSADPLGLKDTLCPLRRHDSLILISSRGTLSTVCA